MKNCLEIISITWTAYQNANIFNQLQTLTDIIRKQQNEGNSMTPSEKGSKQHTMILSYHVLLTSILNVTYLMFYSMAYRLFFQNFNTVQYHLIIRLRTQHGTQVSDVYHMRLLLSIVERKQVKHS